MSGKLDFEKAAKRSKVANDRSCGYHVSRAAAASLPPSENQRELVARLRRLLENHGIDTSYIKEPDNRREATYVITSLIRLRHKHKIRGDYGNTEAGTHG